MASSKDSVFDMIKLGLILVAYAVASCTVLAVVNNATSAKIRRNQIDKANSAMKAVFADADDFEPVTDFSAGASTVITVSDVYLAKKDGAVAGGVVQVSGPTYDRAKIIIGLRTDGTVSGVQFLENTDSPGFGQKASDPTFTLANGKTFYGQFAGKNAADGFVAGKTFDAISGATITSAGVASLITEGTNVLSSYFTEHNYE